MADEASDKPKFCDDAAADGHVNLKRHTECEKNTWHSEVRKSVSYEEDSDDDDDDLPLSVRLLRIHKSGTCNNNCDDSVKKGAVKRSFDNSNPLHIPVKKPKASPYDDDYCDDNITIAQRIKRSAISFGKSFSMAKKFIEKELALVEKSFEECQRKRRVEEQRLLSLQRDIEKCSKELESKKSQVGHVQRINEVHKKMQRKIEECATDLVAKEAHLYLMEGLIREHKQELKTIDQVKDNVDRDRERKEEELEALSQKIAGSIEELKTSEKDLDAIQIAIDGQAKELVSERKKYLEVMSLKSEEQAQMKHFESMKKQYEGQVKDLESKEKQCAGRVKELESMKKQYEGQVKDLESKEKQCAGRVKELESKVRYVDRRVKELESKKWRLEGQVKELELEKKYFGSRVEELKSKEKQSEGRVKELESKVKQLEGRMKEFKSKDKQFKRQVKELESKKKHYESQVKELESKEKQFERRGEGLKSEENKFKVQEKELNSKENRYDGKVKELVSEEKQFEVQVKELKSKGKQFERQVKDLESKQNKFDGQLKELELIEKQHEALIKPFEEEKDSDGSLQLLPSMHTDELESLDDEILVNLMASSDPSEVVLDIIQNPIITQCRKGDNAVIIDDHHIALLDQLRKISPRIKPHVREEAMKLALDLKANMSESTEDSLSVLGFLLLLSIFGLAPSFEEDEVLKLFGFAAQHMIAVELFGTLGLADKISDFVQSLIRKQQHIEAVRFICAYNSADKNQTTYLLRECVQNAKLISESSCKKTNSTEIKDKARDEEIASLRSVLQCISDNSIECEDLLNEIQDRIVELNRQKGK